MSERNFVWDDRAPTFARVADVMTLIAEDHCGVEIDDITANRWRDLLMMLRV